METRTSQPNPALRHHAVALPAVSARRRRLQMADGIPDMPRWTRRGRAAAPVAHRKPSHRASPAGSGLNATKCSSEIYLHLLLQAPQGTAFKETLTAVFGSAARTPGRSRADRL